MPLFFSTSDLVLSRDGYEPVQSGYVDNSYDGTMRRLETPVFRLTTGVYEVKVDFETGNQTGTGVTGVESYASEYYSAAENSLWVRSGRARLLDYQDSTSYRVYISGKERQLTIKNTLDDGWDTWLLVHSVEVRYLPFETAAGRSIVLLAFFLFVDLVLAIRFFRYFIPEKIWAKRARIFFVLVAALISSVPVLGGYLMEGIDIHFHLVRIKALAEGLKAGYFPVRIYPEILNGYGYANGVFYGDALLYFPAILYALGISIGVAYRIFIVFMNILTAAISDFSFRRLSGDRLIGSFTGIIYTISLFRLSEMYTWSSVGMWTAMAFLPLAAVGFYDIYKGGEDNQDGRGCILLAIGVAGVLLTHVLTFLMMMAFLILAALILFKTTFTKKVFTEILKAAGISIAVCCAFIIPFLDGYIHFPIKAGSFGGEIYDYTIFPVQMFTNSFTAAGENVPYDTLSSMRGEAPLSLGIAAGVICILSILVAILRPEYEKRKELRICIFFAFLSIFLSSNWFPYVWISDLLPAVYNLFKPIQFATRFLTIGTLMVAMLNQINLDFVEKYYGRNRAILMSFLILMLSAVFSIFYIDQYCNEADECIDEYDIDRSDMMNVGYGEYILKGSSDFTDSSLRVSSNDIDAGIMERTGLTIRSHAANNSAGPAFIDYPLMAYDNMYLAETDDQRLAVTASEDARVRVEVPSGFNGEITVRYREPVLWRISEIISMIAVILLIARISTDNRVYSSILNKLQYKKQGS